jgi:hypothetical protein
MNTQQLIEQLPIDQADKDTLLQAIATRGKNKGYLKADAPGTNIGWQYLIGLIAPARLKTFSIMLNNVGPDSFDDLDEKLKPMEPVIRFFINGTEPAFRWNLAAHRYDLEAIQRAWPVWLENYKKEGDLAP